MQTITYKESLSMDLIYIDTRSPGEFETDHIPDAVNLPILDNEERAIVGTIYTRVDKEEAIEKGFAIYEQKIEDFKKQLKRLATKKMVIYCFRGGMRSETITKLAMEIGLDAVQLKGGYKTYRKYVRERLNNYQFKPRLVVLHGLTGTGKTDIIQKCSDSIDLEGLAKHRSSVFGAIGLSPVSQKMFESQLLIEMDRLQDRKYVLIEGESRKIGNIIIPEFFFEAMKTGINVKIEASMDERVARLMKIYTSSKENIIKIRQITATLVKRLGKQKVNTMLELLEQNKPAEFMKRILIDYYDPLYSYSISEIDYELTVSHDDAVSVLKKKFALGSISNQNKKI